MNPPLGGGLRFAFSSGQFSTSKSGSKKFTSKTTQFVQGKKFPQKETTTLHPDGRREIIIEGNNFVQRRWTNSTKKKNIPEYTDSADDVPSVKMQPEHSDDPWYVSAWKGVREQMTMCLNHPWRRKKNKKFQYLKKNVIDDSSSPSEHEDSSSFDIKPCGKYSNLRKEIQVKQNTTKTTIFC